MKEIKEYLPYYIGQRFRYRYVDWDKDSWSPWTILNGRDIEKMSDLSIDKIELECRKLSSMTEDESIEYVEIDRKYRLVKTADWAGVKMEAEKTHYLLKKGFDLFGLIEKNLAIDKVSIIKEL